MTLVLGESFRLPDVLPADPGPDPNDIRIELVLEALESLRSSLNLLPAPQVTIDAPDLSAIVNAVNGLRPGVVDPDEIGRAVANALLPMRPDAASADWQDRLVKALETLDYRMKGIGANSGAHGVINLPNEPARQLGIVSVTGPITTTAADGRTLTERMFAKAPQAGYSLYLDTADVTYIYLAEFPAGSATGGQGIRVVKDANGNPLGGVQTATNFAWASRSSATWAS